MKYQSNYLLYHPHVGQLSWLWEALDHADNFLREPVDRAGELCTDLVERMVLERVTLDNMTASFLVSPTFQNKGIENGLSVKPRGEGYSIDWNSAPLTF